MLIQIDKDWIVSISEITEARRCFDDTCTGISFRTSNHEVSLPDKDRVLWRKLLAACIKTEDAEPLD